MKNPLLIFLILSLLSIGAIGQIEPHTIKKESGTSSPKASLDQIAWVAGHWQGEAFGGQTEEIWSSPRGGSMMGSFKLNHGNKIAFYELCVLREVDETILFQLRHFNDDLKGWEEKNETVDFPLIKITENKVFFDQFTIERISKDEIHMYVVIHDDEGEEEEVQFIYHRVK